MFCYNIYFSDRRIYIQKLTLYGNTKNAYMYCHWSSSYQEGKVVIPLTGLTPPQFLCLSQARTWISNVICHGLFMFSELRQEVFVRFVDIGGIGDHHCLNFLIITLAYNFIFVGLWFTSHFSNLPYVMYKKVQTLRNCLLFFKLK